jgi:hypothetical protein
MQCDPLPGRWEACISRSDLCHSVIAVGANRNTRVFLMETQVVADEGDY